MHFGHADKDELPLEQIARLNEALADALHHKRLAMLLDETL